MSSAQAINYPLVYNTICPIGSLPDPNAYGAPGGAGYTPGYATAYFGSGAPGSGASLQVVVGTTPASGTNPGNYGQIIAVNIGQTGTGVRTGTGYQLGQPIYFTDTSTGTGPKGSGAWGYVSGIVSSAPFEVGYVGAITEVSLPPNGIANQILGMITGSGYATYYATKAVWDPVDSKYGSNITVTIPNNGAVGAFNDQVSGYYTQSSMYQSQISNIIACLNQISAATKDETGPSGTQIVQGGGTLPSGVTSWYTYAIATSVTGTIYNNYYTIPVSGTLTVYQYLSQYASIALNTGQSGTQAQSANIQIINSGLSPIQSNLGTANSFLQSAVSTLQSQISQFQQIVSQFYSAVQGAAGNIR